MLASMPWLRSRSVSEFGPRLLVRALVLCLISTELASATELMPSKMYTSIRDGSLQENVFSSPIEGLRRLEIQSVELKVDPDFGVRALDSNDKVFLRSDEDVKAYRQKVEGLGLRICALSTARDFSVGEMESNIAWLSRVVEMADLLGASAVRIDSAMSKEMELDFETRVKLFADGLGGVIQKTAGSTVNLGIENHGLQGNNLAFLLYVIQLVGSDRLGLTLDVGNFYWRGYPLSEVYGILRILAPYTKHTHVKNIQYPPDKREITREVGWEYETYCSPLDEGDIDLGKVLGMLAAAGYKGDICIEDECLNKYKTNEQRAAVLERDVAHLRGILEKLP